MDSASLPSLPAAPPLVPVPQPSSSAAGSAYGAPAGGDADSVVGELEEVATLDDLIVKESIILDGTGPPPSDIDDGDSYIDDDASSLASDAMVDAEPMPEPEPPAEDHSVMQLAVHTEPVFAVAVCTAAPEIFASGGGDDVGYLWRTGQPAPAFKLEGHTDTVSALGFSADGSMLASGGLDGTVRVWQVATGALVVALEGPTQGINWLAWHTRGAVLLAGSEDATAWMWKLPEGSVMQIFSAHSASVSYGGFVNQGRSVVTASEDGTVRVWNPRSGTVDHCLHAGAAHEPRPVTCLGGHATQPVFLFGADDGTLRLAHAESGKLLAHLPAHDASVESAAFCDAMPLAASAGMDGKLCVWDLGTFGMRHTCIHPAGVVEVRWLRDSPLLLSCAVSRELRLWDGRSGECLQTLTGHHEAVLCFDVGYTAHGVYVVSGSDDKTARVWQPRL